MRVRVIAATVVALSAPPVYAQSTDVTGPRTLTNQMVMCTDLPVTSKAIPRITVAGPHVTDGRTAMTEGLVVINRTPDDGLAVGQRYIAQRLRNDTTGYPGGSGFGASSRYGDLRVSGWVTVRAIDEFNALAQIDAACDSIEIGDYLEPYVETPLPTSATARVYPDFSDRANILFGVDNRVLFGDGDVFSIDRGTAHGVAAGNRYAIYRDFHNNLPLVYMGDAVVMSTTEQTSKVVVTNVVDGIQVGDVAVPRRAASQQ
jgi:hypothetical protein